MKTRVKMMVISKSRFHRLIHDSPDVEEQEEGFSFSAGATAGGVFLNRAMINLAGTEVVVEKLSDSDRYAYRGGASGNWFWHKDWLTRGLRRDNTKGGDL